MLPCPTVRLFGGMIVGLVLCTTGLGQETRSRPLSPDSSRLLEDLANGYRTTPAYSDKGELQVEFVTVPKKATGKPKTVKAAAQLKFARPNKIALTYGVLRIICDGNEMTTVIDANKRYHVGKAPKEITLETFRSHPLKDAFLMDQSGLYLPILLTLLLGQGPATDLFVPYHLADRMEADHVVDGKKCRCLQLLRPLENRPRSLLSDGQADMRLLVDPDAKRFLGFELDYPVRSFFFSALPFPPPELPPGIEGAVIESPAITPALMPRKARWVSGQITDEVPASSAFTFRAPPGYQRVDDFEDLFNVVPPVVFPAPEPPKGTVREINDLRPSRQEPGLGDLHSRDVDYRESALR